MACPVCGSSLAVSADGCHCDQGHTFPLTSDVVSFADKRETDKYDDPGLAARYVQYSFGASVMRNGRVPDGRSEALYRTVSDICHTELIRRNLKSPLIVDLACGVGRTVYDIAATHKAAVVLGMDLSRVMASTAAAICGGMTVRCGAAEDGWPEVQFFRPQVHNAFIAQADACRPPLRKVSEGGTGAAIVLSHMLIDRLYTVDDVEQSLAYAADLVEPGGMMVVTSPFNWITQETWNRYGGSRSWILERLKDLGLIVEVAFDYLPYRECLDPFGTTLELPVLVCTGRGKPEADGSAESIRQP